jgi:hypothetical protein
MEKAKRGRRPLPEGKRLVNVGLALHPAVLEELRAVAVDYEESQTAIVERALAREFKRMAKAAARG